MNIEQLKQSWKEASEKLPQHAFNKTLVRELITSKSSSAIQKLFKWDFVNMTIVLLMIPVIVWLTGYVENHFMPRWGFHALIVGRMLYVFSYAELLGRTVWYIVKFRFLLPLDASKPVAHNQLYMAKYNLMNKIEKIITIIEGTVSMALCTSLYAVTKADTVLWTFLVCAGIIGILSCIYIYKMVYNRHIASIQTALQELKELESDEA
jgi:hypothetical protein